MSGDVSLDISLLPWQQEVWNDPARFKVVAAGRRTGKSILAIYRMIVEALETPGCDVFYIAPTQGQARDIIWNPLLDATDSIRTDKHINNLQIRLANGSRISLKGSDRPDTMRGVKLKYAVLDEYADMKPDVWELIVRPALADLRGSAMFIGTPMGRNHFYELYKKAEADGKVLKAWHFTSYDNPVLPEEEIEAAKETMSSFSFRQEFMASFEARGSEIFREEWIKYSDEEPEGEYYIAIDLAGFETGKKARRLDNSSIAIVKVSHNGWWVKEIVYGRWSVDETAETIFKLVDKYRPVSVGIEKGISKQAVMSPLFDLMKRNSRFFRIEELTHGNQKKTERIIWALEGRFEQGFITLNPGDWNNLFLDELFQFPDPLTHDDTVDSLAYIDQLAKVSYQSEYEYDDFEFLDPVAGY